MQDAAVMVFGFERPNLHLSVTRAPDERSADAAVAEVVAGMDGTGLVYVDTRARAEELAASLSTDDRPALAYHAGLDDDERAAVHERRSEEHTSELQSLMRTSYAVFCLKKKKKHNKKNQNE